MAQREEVSLKFTASYAQIRQAVKTSVDEVLNTLDLNQLVQAEISKYLEGAKKRIETVTDDAVARVAAINVEGRIGYAIQNNMETEIKRVVENKTTRLISESISIALTQLVEKGVSVQLKPSWGKPGVVLRTEVKENTPDELP